MSRAIALVLIFAAAFAGFLIAGMPLSTALALANARERGIDYADASGTIWRGATHGVRVAGQDVGDVEVSLSPMSLFTGGAVMRIETHGALRVRGAARAGLSGRIELTNASFVADARDLVRLHPELSSRGGEIFIRLDQAVFDGTGACLSASGAVQSDVLARGATRSGWRGPVLEGEISCSQGAIAIVLEGAEAGTSVRIDALLSAHAGARVTADVETDSLEVAAALAYLGFEERAEGFTYAYMSGQDSNAQDAAS